MKIPILNNGKTLPISWMTLGDSITIICKFFFPPNLLRKLNNFSGYFNFNDICL